MKSELRKFSNVTEKTKKNMRRIKRNNTSIELTLRKALWKKGIRYRKNYKGLPGTPDIVITKYKIAIFCDSEFFHGKDWEVLKPRLEKGNNPRYWVTKIQENINRDRDIDNQLLYKGWTVVHFWGKDILKKTDECVAAIQDIIFEHMISDEDDFSSI